MTRALPAETVHLPFEAGPFRMAMGLVARDPGEMIELDERYPAEMAERRALLEGRREEVLAWVPGSEAARAEVLATLARMLPARYPDWFGRDGVMLHNHLTGETWDLAAPGLDPLEVAGRLVQEDLCLLRPEADGPVLIGAALCFPSRWSLREKLGRRLADVHGPVPLYGERLARPVDRLIGTLKAGKLVERLNWSLVDDAALFQPAGHGRRQRNLAVTAENAGAQVFLRVERQTLSRLPESGTVLFTIRIHRYPLARIAAQAAVAGELLAAVRALPEAMAAYKSLPTIREAVEAYLQAAAAAR